MQASPPLQSLVDQQVPGMRGLHCPATQVLSPKQSPSMRQQFIPAGTQMPGALKFPQRALQGQTNAPEQMPPLHSSSRQQLPVVRGIQLPSTHSSVVELQSMSDVQQPTPVQMGTLTAHWLPSQVATVGVPSGHWGYSQ